ncbi:hypothetical protein C8R47DRAFT_1228949 [Mycena vitilis]|nr:hypothetical protein C8R47DRAFT_1228949 [Mycena vitilis]
MASEIFSIFYEDRWSRNKGSEEVNNDQAGGGSGSGGSEGQGTQEKDNPLDNHLLAVVPAATGDQEFLYAKDFLALLFVGFQDSNEAWRAVLEPLTIVRKDWKQTCEQSVADDEGLEQEARLLAAHKLLAQKHGMDQGVFFVDFVLRQIEILKFICTWVAPDSQKGWKTRYLNAAFEHDYADLVSGAAKEGAGSQAKAESDTKVEKARAKFRKDHGKAILERKNLALLYQKFGPGIFLDRVWDTVGDSASLPTKRSTIFHKLTAKICTNLPQFEDAPVPLPTTTYAVNADSLYRILRILTGGDEVSQYICEYIRKNPPEEYGLDFTWGLVSA